MMMMMMMMMMMQYLGGQSGRWKRRLCMYGDNLRRNAAHVYSGYTVTRGACAVEARA